MADAVRAFTTDLLHWSPHLRPVALEAATSEQREALKVTPSNTAVSDYLLVLAHDPESLARRTPLYNAIMYGRGGLSRAGRELGAVGASIVNRCVYCASVHAARFNQLTRSTETIARIFADGPKARLDEREQATFDLSVKLSQSPPQAGPRDIRRLRAAGLGEVEIIDLIFSTALFAWANRLMHTLGEPVRPAPQR